MTHQPQTVAARADRSGRTIILGPLEVDIETELVRVRGTQVELTPMEFRLLSVLASRQGQVQSRAQLLETVWNAAPDIQTRTVDMHVQRLRAKLDSAGMLIETVRGSGYRFRLPREAYTQATTSEGNLEMEEVAF